MEVAHWCSMWSSDLLSPHITNYIWLSCSFFNSPITPQYWSPSWVSWFCTSSACISVCISVSVCVKVNDALFPFFSPLENVSHLPLPPSHSCLSSLQLKPDKALPIPSLVSTSVPRAASLIGVSVPSLTSVLLLVSLIRITSHTFLSLISSPPLVSLSPFQWVLSFSGFFRLLSGSLLYHTLFFLSLTLTQCSKCMKRRLSELYHRKKKVFTCYFSEVSAELFIRSVQQWHPEMIKLSAFNSAHLCMKYTDF